MEFVRSVMEEIEQELGIETCPVNWPIGSGKRFAGEDATSISGYAILIFF